MVPEGISAAVKKALEFIREHYEEQISLQDAADAAEVNPAYLSYLQTGDEDWFFQLCAGASD